MGLHYIHPSIMGIHFILCFLRFCVSFVGTATSKDHSSLIRDGMRRTNRIYQLLLSGKMCSFNAFSFPCISVVSSEIVFFFCELCCSFGGYFLVMATCDILSKSASSVLMSFVGADAVCELHTAKTMMTKDFAKSLPFEYPQVAHFCVLGITESLCEQPRQPLTL